MTSLEYLFELALAERANARVRLALAERANARVGLFRHRRVWTCWRLWVYSRRRQCRAWNLVLQWSIKQWPQGREWAIKQWRVWRLYLQRYAFEGWWDEVMFETWWWLRYGTRSMLLPDPS